MKISRRALLGMAIGAAGAAAAGVGVVAAFAGPGARPAAPVRGGGDTYQPGPGDPRRKGPGDMIMQHMSNQWHSHLLPFAAPFRDKPTLLAELKRGRAQRLFV